VLNYLREGDIVTHMFTAHPGGLLDSTGKIWPQVRDAKESGVLMDVGHGLHNLNFDVARKVLDQGLHPDSVSTDGHRGNRAGPVLRSSDDDGKAHGARVLSPPSSGNGNGNCGQAFGEDK
jgi:predicted amidohydrolase